MMRTIDLFSGCGGMALGFRNAGFQLVAAFDNWGPAVKVYSANMTDHPCVQMDLGNGVDFELLESYGAEVVIGGPPCQDFSSAGWRDESRGRADLTVSFAQIVSRLQPEYFVMENVDRIRKSRTLTIAYEVFRRAGYGLTAEVLDASYCGVPQIRKRFFVIGHLGAHDDFLLPYLLGSLSDRRLTVREYMGDRLNIEYYYRHPWSYKRRAIFSVDEPSPTVRGVNRPVPAGYSGHPRDAAPVTKDLRPLTTEERSFIQTFPRGFLWQGSKTDIEQMIGNAVPVKLAEYIAVCLDNYIEDGSASEKRDLKEVTGGS